MIVRASGSMTAVVGTAITATAVTAIVLGPSGASQLTSNDNSITVRPPRQACNTNGQISRNQRSNWRAWRRDQNNSGRGFGELAAGLTGASGSAGSKKVMSSAAAVPIVTSKTRFTAIAAPAALPMTRVAPRDSETANEDRVTIQAEIAAHQGSSECKTSAATTAKATESAAARASVPRGPRGS